MAMNRKQFAQPISVASETPASIVDPQHTDKMAFEFDHLPKEIAVEILLRSPVESLMQFKLVNKTKYSLITGLIKDPKFIVKHLDYHSKANISASLVSCHLVPIHENSAETVYEPSVSVLTLLSNQGKVSCIGEDLQLPPIFNNKDALGYRDDLLRNLKVSHCDGIVCIVNKFFTVSFCNPVLREFKTFRPKSVLDQLGSWRYMIEEAGLGYDSKSNKYKVVRVFTSRNPSELRAEVYTLGTDSWREIDIFIPDGEWQCTSLDCPLYYKGCCYWLMLCYLEGISISMVLCFDMSSEVFQTVALPNYNDCKMIMRPRLVLAMWNGYVCLLCYDEVVGSSLIRKWVMEIERLDGPSSYNYSWRECKSIGLVPGLFMSPYTFWKEDELLVRTRDHQIGSYNVGTKKLGLLPGVPWKFCSKPYVASLVSIKTEAKVTSESST